MPHDGQTLPAAGAQPAILPDLLDLTAAAIPPAETLLAAATDSVRALCSENGKVSGTLIEDIAANWAALYLVQIAGVATGTAGLGYVVMIGAQFIGRLLGDPATDKWGRVPVIVSGGVMILVGGLLVVAIPQPAVVMVGYALAGYGCATIVPAAFAAAGRLPGLPEGAGVTMVGWLMRLGFLCTSPLVGAVSDLTNLRVGLAVLPLAGLAVCLLARAARPRTAS